MTAYAERREFLYRALATKGIGSPHDQRVMDAIIAENATSPQTRVRVIADRAREAAERLTAERGE
jgi:hypothetical protein